LVLTVYVGLASVAAIALAIVGRFRLGLGGSWRLLDRADRHEIVSIGSTAYAGTLLQFLNYRFDYWLVRHFTDVASLGVYSLAATLAQLLWLLPRSAAGVFFPTVASGAPEAAERQVVVGRVALLGSAVFAVAGAVTARWWMPLLYGESFRPGVLVFGLLLVGAVPYAGTVIWASALAGKGLQRENTWASLWGFVATVGLDLALIPQFGLTGAAVASSLSYIATTAYVAWRLAGTMSVPVVVLVVPRRSDAATIWNVCQGFLRRLR
jgi:O-antigen/teichoic acid export membrane protein